MTWVLADEATPETDKLFDSFGTGAKTFAPHLWVWEIVNVLLSIRPLSPTPSDRSEWPGRTTRTVPGST